MESSSSTEGSSAPYVVGRLGRPHGLEGFLGLYVDDAETVHFRPGLIVHVGDSRYTVRSLRQGARGPEVAFVEVTSRGAAEEIRGQDVTVQERRPLGDEEFWPADLIGLEVRPGGGTVIDVRHGAAQDRLVIERSGTTFEVPFVDELVPVVDRDEGYVEILEIEGLSQPGDRG